MGILETLLRLPVQAAPLSSSAIAPQAYEQRGEFTFADEVAAGYFGVTQVGNIEVSEKSALGVSAWYRGLAIISGTISGLPLKSYRKLEDGSREQVSSWLDNPGGPLGMTPAEWCGQVIHYLASGGEVFLMHIYDEAGRIIGAWPVHRSAVNNVERRGFEKWFEVQTNEGGLQWFDSNDMTQVMLMSLDGLRGENPISLFRKGIAFNIAAEESSTNLVSRGFNVAGMVTTEEDVEEEEGKVIKAALNSKGAGPAHAGEIAFVNRQLKFTPWQSTAMEAQFIEQRAMGVEEVARMLGIPPHLLAQTEKQTSWGTGVAEQNLGLARYTLRPYTDRLEQALSKLLPRPRFVEFDYKGLLQGTPEAEIKLLIEQVKGGLLTKDEARAILNLPPLTEEQKAESAPPPPPAADPNSKEPPQ